MSTSTGPGPVESTCSSCRKPKAPFSCGVCEARLCKNCVQLLEPEALAFKTSQPAELGHYRYCANCFAEHVEPVLGQYEETLELAKSVYVFFKTQKRQPPVLKKSKHELQVKDNPDRDETILRLAFQAAELGFNAIIETDVASVKVKNEAHSKLSWSGKCFPAEVDAVRLDREAYREDNF